MLNLGLLIDDGYAKAPNGPLRGVQLAIDEYNADQKSTYRVHLRERISDGTADSAKQGAEQLAGTERIIGVVAPLTAEETDAVRGTFEQASVPLLATSGESEGGSGYRTFRRLLASPRQEGAAVSRYMMRRVNSPALVFHDGSSNGSAFAEGAKQVLEAAQRPVLSSQKINAKTDLEGVLGSVPRDAQSFVLYGGDGALGANFVDALRRGQYKGPVVTSHQIMEARPTGLPDGVVAGSPLASASDPGLKGFDGRFSARFRTAPGPLAVESYEGALMVLEAVEEVEPKPREITEFLQLSRSFLGDSKSYDYDDNGELKSPPVWIYQTRGGAWAFAGRFGQPRARAAE